MARVIAAERNDKNMELSESVNEAVFGSILGREKI
jgi:hypothetical protein